MDFKEIAMGILTRIKDDDLKALLNDIKTAQLRKEGEPFSTHASRSEQAAKRLRKES